MTEDKVLWQFAVKSMEEKREVKRRELDAMLKDDKVKAYLELRKGMDTLEEAIARFSKGAAHANVGAILHTAPAPRRASARAAAYQLARTGGERLNPGGRYRVMRAAYTAMLQEFRGAQSVSHTRITKWMRKQFGISNVVIHEYIEYGQLRGIITMHTSWHPGQPKLYSFPSEYNGVSDEPAQEPVDELRKAGLIK